jgi:asparagine synthase (glutamine-hydrolysing)
MCGIYGVVNKKVDRELAMKCLNTMIHRGPDGYGLWQEDGVTLGHRRLSILDLAVKRHPVTLICIGHRLASGIGKI